jgi:hypothetical protein
LDLFSKGEERSDIVALALLVCFEALLPLSRGDQSSQNFGTLILNYVTPLSFLFRKIGNMIPIFLILYIFCWGKKNGNACPDEIKKL